MYIEVSSKETPFVTGNRLFYIVEDLNPAEELLENFDVMFSHYWFKLVGYELMTVWRLLLKIPHQKKKS